MNIIDRNFFSFADEISSISEKEIYYRMRRAFDKVPVKTQRSCMEFFGRFGFWGRLDIDKGIYEEIELKAKELNEHIEDFVRFYEQLSDYRSKKTLYGILNNWYSYDFDTTTRTKEYLFDEYFDLDVVKCDEKEVIADLGAYTGDTVLSYIRNYGEECYKKIYCYEITPEIFTVLESNLKDVRDVELIRKGVADKPGRMTIVGNEASVSANTLGEGGGEEVEVTTLDIDISEPVTLIKADIEGSEQKAIAGAARHIAKDHPKLLISVYHGNEDLWKVPKMISDISDDYSFYLRYRSSPVYPTEISLIAV